ncbi:MAG TPA: DUF998 domain-containing protein [Acidimicrobiia bacterium]|nr:DUF998 domain-containing protein [Acidimicrobiia bacterium]
MQCPPSATGCTPVKILAAAALLFLIVVFVEGAFRSGYDPTRHMISALSLGDHGWVQVANFILFGVGMLVFAIGLYLDLDMVADPVLIAVFGLGAIVSGVFSMDPSYGCPPRTPRGTSRPTRHHLIHGAAGPIMFLSIFVACLVLADSLDQPWPIYTYVTAAVGLLLTVAVALAAQRDSMRTGLIQEDLYWCTGPGSL